MNSQFLLNGEISIISNWDLIKNAMVDEIEVMVTDIEKKHPSKSGYEGMYSLAKHLYMDDEKIDTTGFAIDKENLKILRAKIEVEWL